MRNIEKKIFILVIFVGLLAALRFHLRQNPVPLFVLKGIGTNVEAFRLDFSLDRNDFFVRSLGLNLSQKKEGGEILKNRDSQRLTAYSKSYGKFAAVIGEPTEEDGWPDYLGGGIKSIFGNHPSEWFDNLGWGDRFYFALFTHTPLPPPFVPSDIQVEDLTKISSSSADARSNPSPTPVAVSHPGVLRVEILNGCGITGAADWMARRFQGPGITIISTGNADHFHYLGTVVRSSA
ncbi:MAG TPA: LytR C-terminal domain-containing protein, partial [bacterium]